LLLFAFLSRGALEVWGKGESQDDGHCEGRDASWRWLGVRGRWGTGGMGVGGRETEAGSSRVQSW
jgi:hypothetical protein